MTQKLRLSLLIILGLMLTALISRNAALIWMVLPFMVLILSGLLSIPKEICLSAYRIISHQRCEAGTLITMTLVIENNGRDIPSLTIHESFSPKIQIIGKYNEKYGILPCGDKAKITYEFLAPRGEYSWEHIRLTVSDLFNIFGKTIELPADAEVVVLPNGLPGKNQKLNPSHTLSSPGLYRSNLSGSGVDFFGVREYFSGDPLRSIYWRLSARYPNRLFSKEYEREEIADVGLIVDGSAAMNLQSGKAELYDFTVQIAADLARRILREGNRLSMLIVGNRVLRVFPSVGKQQLARILNQLAASQPGENVSLGTIKYLPVKLFPSHALIILITPLRESDIPAITRLLACGYQVQVVCPDPVKFVGRSSCHPLAVRAAVLERAVLLWRIREMGVEVFEWPTDNNAPFSEKIDKENPDFKTTMKPNRVGLEIIGQPWFSYALLVLMVCGVAIGLLLGFSKAILLAVESLTMGVLEILNLLAIRRKGTHLEKIKKYKRAQIRHMVFIITISLLISEVGLLVHIPLPFGIVVLTGLLLLFSIDRIHRLMTR